MKQQVMEKIEGATLDGQPAIVAEKPDGFFIVKLASGRGGDVEFCKQTVERIIKNGGAFLS